ncbi:hypothetical protein F66182_9370 [Fusarium sp. NRRL 66182]|nr:hypothetical protein F66182_9370 [Fusarium sp. NRRL 66182]
MNSFMLIDEEEVGIGFRVECRDEASRLFNSRLSNKGDMLPRGRRMTGSFEEATDAHLSWTRIDTPFISYFRTWERAMRFRRRLLDRGGKGIVVIAVWLKGLVVYDAHSIATSLGYPSVLPSGMGHRQRLEHHIDELLVKGGIRSWEYRILACFTGDSLEYESIMSPPPRRPFGYRFSSLVGRVPIGSLTGIHAPCENLMQELAAEVYSLAGVRDEAELHALADWRFDH